MPQLRDYQIECVKFLRENGYRALDADAPGTGKTPTLLATIGSDSRRLAPALVVCPASVVTNWGREAKVWTPRAKVHLIVDQRSEIPDGMDIVITSWDLMTFRADELTSMNWNLIVGDEVHYLRNPEAKRSKAAQSIAAKTPYRIALSGTPLVNVKEDLEALQQFLGRSNPPMIRRLIEDVAPDVPTKHRILLHCGLPKSIEAEYRKIEADFGSWIDAFARAEEEPNRAKSAHEAEAFVKIGYMRRLLGVGKIPTAVAWTIRSVRAGEPILVFGEHQEVLNGIATGLRRASVPYVRLDGETGRRDRVAAIDAFQAGKVPIFLGSSAAREGITLTRAARGLFAERWWNPAAEEQGEDRLRRIGQTRETFWHYLHCPGTFDDRQHQIIESKRELVKRSIGSWEVDEREGLQILDEIERGPKFGAAAYIAASQGRFPKVADLPPVKRVHCIYFSRENWMPESIERWMQSNGYPKIRVSNVNRPARSDSSALQWIRVELNPILAFVPRSFKQIGLCPGIKAVVGDPMSDKERKRRGL